MPRDIIRPRGAAALRASYSPAVRAAGLIFVSGTGPYDDITGRVIGGTIQEQTRQCLSRIAALLSSAGSSLDRVVSATVILREEADFEGMNEDWSRWFPVDPPARQGAKMPVHTPGVRVSIAVVAEA